MRMNAKLSNSLTTLMSHITLLALLICCVVSIGCSDEAAKTAEQEKRRQRLDKINRQTEEYSDQREARSKDANEKRIREAREARKAARKARLYQQHRKYAAMDSLLCFTAAPIVEQAPRSGKDGSTPTQSSGVKAVTLKHGRGLWTREATVAFEDDGNTGPVILTVKFLPDAASLNWDYGNQWVSEKNSSYSVLAGEFRFNTPEKRAAVKKYVTQWSRHCNIRFKFIEYGKNSDADIRINFVPDIARDKTTRKPVWVWQADSDVATTGTPKDQNTPTMNLGCPDWQEMKEDARRRVILHEFGHALGFHHEHKNINARLQWNVAEVLKYYKDKAGWNRARTELNVLNPLSKDEWNFSEYDPDSIMLYSIPNVARIGTTEYKLSLNDFESKRNTSLSKLDIAAVKRMYPVRGTVSGNGIVIKKIRFTIRGSDKFLGSYRDWTKTFYLPSGKIDIVDVYTTYRRRGHLSRWVWNERQGTVTLRGRIEDGTVIYGKGYPGRISPKIMRYLLILFSLGRFGISQELLLPRQ